MWKRNFSKRSSKTIIDIIWGKKIIKNKVVDPLRSLKLLFLLTDPIFKLSMIITNKSSTIIDSINIVHKHKVELIGVFKKIIIVGNNIIKITNIKKKFIF